MTSLEMVRQFHLLFGHPVRNEPTPNNDDPKLRVLRIKLIAEELKELAEASGVYLEVKVGGAVYNKDVDLVEVADALGDLIYVVNGAALVYGIPIEDVVRAIHASNTSKLGNDLKPIYNEDGKVMKGPNYYPPTGMIKHLLEEYSNGR